MEKIKSISIVKKASKASKKTKQTKEAKQVAKYKKLTGKKRISKEYRNLINKGITATKLAKGAISGKKLNTRIRSFERKYGTASSEQIEMLKFDSPLNVLKLTDISSYNKVQEEKAKKKAEKEAYETKIEEPAKVEEPRKPIPQLAENFNGDGHLDYDELPGIITSWSHEPGRFLYNNAAWSKGIDMYRLENGKDHTAYEAAKIIVSMRPQYIFDPEETGNEIWYDSDEWELYLVNKKEYDDYITLKGV